MGSFLQQCRNSALLSTIPSAALGAIEQETEERTYRRRQIVYFAQQKNDYVFLLSSGRVKLLRTGVSGREVTLDIVSPDELFGEANMYSADSAYGSSAEVLEDAVVFAMRRSCIVEQTQFNLDTLREFAALEVRRRFAAEQRLSEFVFYDVSTRLAHLLGQLSGFYDRPGPDNGVMIQAKLTHQELANLVGSTRETTTLILNDFKRRKLIAFQRRKIIVLDINALMRFESQSENHRSGSSAREVASKGSSATVASALRGHS